MRIPLVKQVSCLLLASAFSLATALSASSQDTSVGQAAPSGPVSLSFTNSAAPVYDLTGSYQIDQQFVAAHGVPVNLSLGFSVQQDATGRLRGSGVTNIQVGTDLPAAAFSVNGKVTGGGRKAARATLSIRWLAQDTAGGTNGPFTISVQYNLEVSQGFLNGTARGRAKFTNLGSGSIKSSVDGLPLPAGVDGSWIVNLNLQPPGGTGSILLANGRSVQASLVDSFAAHSGLERIKLAGVGGDRGNSLNISFSPATSTLESLSGKILGQTVVVQSPSGSVLSQNVSLASAPAALASSQICLGCHTPIQQTLNTTVHGPVGVQCENCHGPVASHAANDYDPTTRPPPVTTYSTNDYTLVVTQAVPTNYVANINVCANCHNDRGASWTNSSAPPSPLPQYNMLLGTVGELASVSPYNPSTHALSITNQCLGCHTQTVPYGSPPPTGIYGHAVGVLDSYALCASCHASAENASNLVVFVTAVFTNQIATLQASLDEWATNSTWAATNSALVAKYGTRAWEYTTPGALSPGGPGPNAAEQAAIPANIQQARFNLYLVLYDGSFGVHNPLYSLSLLDTAQNWVEQELSQ
jgi:hypothetical protein